MRWVLLFLATFWTSVGYGQWFRHTSSHPLRLNINAIYGAPSGNFRNGGDNMFYGNARYGWGLDLSVSLHLNKGVYANLFYKHIAFTLDKDRFNAAVAVFYDKENHFTSPLSSWRREFFTNYFGMQLSRPFMVKGLEVMPCANAGVLITEFTLSDRIRLYRKESGSNFSEELTIDPKGSASFFAGGGLRISKTLLPIANITATILYSWSSNRLSFETTSEDWLGNTKHVGSYAYIQPVTLLQVQLGFQVLLWRRSKLIPE
ncbi:MAG TPA: hypothetical protein VIN07_09165 [Flavipsychrobacter sp.]